MHRAQIHCCWLLFAAGCSAQATDQAPQTTGTVTFFEGARLIVGDESAPIENSAFLVENDRFTRVGRKGELEAPPGAARVDLTGKTVMPALVELHAHVGYRKNMTNTVENFTRENIIDHLERFAYHGVAAVLSLGTDRREMAYELRDELRRAPPPNTALYFTGGQGLAMPDGGPGVPMRYAAYGVTTEGEAREAVQEMAARKVDFIKIWVDDRGGAVSKLPAPLYWAAIDEAHKHNIRTMTHTRELADAKDLVRADIDGFAHPPWRERDVDDELIGLLKERPNVFILMTLWASRNEIYGGRPAWLDEPLLRETFPPEEIKQLERSDTDEGARAAWKAGPVPRNVAKLKAAGVRFGLGGDIGGISGGQFFGWSSHMEMASMVEAGLTPAEAITAATRNSAEFLGLDRLGTVAPGKSADFMVLDANPLDNIANTRRIARVYLRGKEVDRAALRAKWTGGSSN
ncbi:MAG: amidohydrolase family protein [Gemmatimonadetes bacterium]|nr:amidohydrolase family protein [Gemmatimonadota bacterium]